MGLQEASEERGRLHVTLKMMIRREKMRTLKQNTEKLLHVPLGERAKAIIISHVRKIIDAAILTITCETFTHPRAQFDFQVGKSL